MDSVSEHSSSQPSATLEDCPYSLEPCQRAHARRRVYLRLFLLPPFDAPSLHHTCVSCFERLAILCTIQDFRKRSARAWIWFKSGTKLILRLHSLKSS